MSVNTKVNGQLVKSAGLYSVTAPIGMADIYSTEEKEVGLWKNNKPLYQKTIVIGNGDVNINTDSGYGTYRAVVDSGVSNIDEGFAVVDKSFIILSSDSSPRYFTWIDYQGKGSSQFVVYTNASRTNVTVVLTIQYTKTTDTPWSGKFVPQGYGYVSSGDIYSLEERQIGVFADGKPLYQKTIDFGTLPNNTSKTVAHGISNLGTVANLYAVAQAPNANSWTFLPRAHTASVNLQISIDASDTGITIATASDRSAYSVCYVTIQYTKTTDVAGSGEYVPSGDKAVHYSTEEEVIGTFMGETLYRKVFNFTNPTAGSNSIQHNISNFGRLINVYGNFSRSDGYDEPIPMPTSNDTFIVSLVDFTSTTCTLKIGSVYAGTYALTNVSVVVEYTKTS